jgi:membrane protein
MADRSSPLNSHQEVLRPQDAATPNRGGRWHRWQRILWRTMVSVFSMDTSMRCSGVAFFGFLSLFPVLATAVLAFGLLADLSFLAQLFDKLEGLVPDIALSLLRGELERLINQPHATLGISILVSISLALWSGSRGINALLFAASRTRRDPDKRSFVASVVMSVVVTLVGSFCLLFALFLVAALPAFFGQFRYLSVNDELILFLRWPLLLVLSTLAIAAIYRFGPDRRPTKGRWIWPGAIVASVLWIAASVLFSLYVENFGNYELSFGAMTANVVLLLWLYNSAQIFVIGAALNAELEYESLAEKSARKAQLDQTESRAPANH